MIRRPSAWAARGRQGLWSVTQIGELKIGYEQKLISLRTASLKSNSKLNLIAYIVWSVYMELTDLPISRSWFKRSPDSEKALDATENYDTLRC